MSSDLRQRSFLLARVAAGLIAVGYLLTMVARTGGEGKSTAVPTAKATRAVATPTVALPAATPARTLCQVIPSLVQVSVQALYPSLPDGGVNVSNSVTLAEPTAVRMLARQLCVLPAEPASSAACDSQPGHWTQFIFGAANAGYWTVWADSGGCMTVLGVGNQARTAAADRRLWSTVLADLRHGHQLGAPTG